MTHKILYNQPCSHCDGTGEVTRIIFDPPIVTIVSEVDEDD